MEQIASRNEAICELIGFKRYIPRPEIREYYERQASPFVMRWWYIPEVGRYNSLNLKFHCNYNWLISAAIEFKKYCGANGDSSTELHKLFSKVQEMSIFDISFQTLWIALSDYALLVLEIKKREQL